MDCGEFVFHLRRRFLSGVWLMEIREREEGGIRRDEPGTKRRKESTAAVTLLSSIVGGDVRELQPEQRSVAEAGTADEAADTGVISLQLCLGAPTPTGTLPLPVGSQQEAKQPVGILMMMVGRFLVSMDAAVSCQDAVRTSFVLQTAPFCHS